MAHARALGFAAAALVALVVALLYLAISAIFHWYILLTSMISLGVAVVAVWFILSRRGLARAVAGVVAAVWSPSLAL